jgi:hypothetical protein
MTPDAQSESRTAWRGENRQGLSRTAHFIIIAVAVVAGGFDRVTRGWGAPITASVLVLFYLAMYWRNCWGRASFWVSVVLISVAQVPLVILARPKIEQNRLYMMGFMLGDIVAAAVVTSLIAQLDPNSPLNARNYSSNRPGGARSPF